jgi:hypothetical protein
MQKDGRKMINDYSNGNHSGDNDLVPYLKTMNCNSIQFELMLFWGWHPQVKLSFETLASIFHITKSRLKTEVESLVKKDVLAEQKTNSGSIIYTLSGNYKMQPPYNKLSRLDWSEILHLKKQLFN